MACCSAKKLEMMQMGRSRDELKDTCVFVCCKMDSQVADIAERGIEVKASSVSNLGKCILSSLYCCDSMLLDLQVIHISH